MPHPKSLAGELQVPALLLQYRDLKRRFYNTPVASPDFDKLALDVGQMKKAIRKAKAQDALLIEQACANLGASL